jgi:hypothetical protein
LKKYLSKPSGNNFLDKNRIEIPTFFNHVHLLIILGWLVSVLPNHGLLLGRLILGGGVHRLGSAVFSFTHMLMQITFTLENTMK